MKTNDSGNLQTKSINEQDISVQMREHYYSGSSELFEKEINYSMGESYKNGELVNIYSYDGDYDDFYLYENIIMMKKAILIVYI